MVAGGGGLGLIFLNNFFARAWVGDSSCLSGWGRDYIMAWRREHRRLAAGGGVRRAGLRQIGRAHV